MPKGGNLAIGGSFNGAEPVAQFVNFGVDSLEVSALNKASVFSNGQGFASIYTLGSDALRLSGDTDESTWDLEVVQDFPELTGNGAVAGEPFSATTENRVGRLPGEVWTVDALWPKTTVQGFALHKSSGELVQIDGKGYQKILWSLCNVS